MFPSRNNEFGSNSAGFGNVPLNKTFAGAVSNPRDYDRKDQMRDRGVIYQTNGSGRDTYIFNDDGGFNFRKNNREQFHPGTLNLPNIEHAKFFEKQKQPYIHSKPVQYNDDGTGRDSYVKATNGGLSSVTVGNRMREYRQAFREQLRNYNQIPSAQYLLDRNKSINKGKETSRREQGNQSCIPNQQRGYEKIGYGYDSNSLNLPLGASPQTKKFMMSPDVKQQKMDKIKQSGRNIYGNPEEVDIPFESYRRGDFGRTMTENKRRDEKFLSNLGLKAVSTVKGIETDRMIARTDLRGNRMKSQIYGSNFDSPRLRDDLNKSVEKSMYTDNQSRENLSVVHQYIQKLDKRLSVPKFSKHSKMTNDQHLFRVGYGLKNQEFNDTHLELQKQKSVISSRDDSPQKKLYNQLSNGDVTKFVKKTVKLIDQGTSDGVSKNRILSTNDSSQMMIKSQVEKQNSRSRAYNRGAILSKVSVEDRENLFDSMKKGQNLTGGVFGGNSPLREPSPSLFVTSKGKITQKAIDKQRYNHSQADAIIVRGNQNIDVNHLVIRKNEFR